MSTLFSSQWWCAEVDLPFLITGWCQGLRIILSRRWRCSTSTNANGLTSQRRWCCCIGFPDLWPSVVGRQVPAWSHFKSKHCCGVGVPDLQFCDYWLIRIALDLSGPLCWGGGVSSSWFCFILFLRGSLDFTLKATVITFECGVLRFEFDNLLSFSLVFHLLMSDWSPMERHLCIQLSFKKCWINDRDVMVLTAEEKLLVSWSCACNNSCLHLSASVIALYSAIHA